MIVFSGNISFCIESMAYHNFKSAPGVNILNFLKLIFLVDLVKMGNSTY